MASWKQKARRCTEHGRAPKSLEELAEAKCAPGVFGKGELTHPDGGSYSLAGDGMSGICSKYGRVEAMSPCLEHLVTEVSGEEAEEYREWRAALRCAREHEEPTEARERERDAEDHRAKRRQREMVERHDARRRSNASGWPSTRVVRRAIRHAPSCLASSQRLTLTR